jgi:hypothetical protein
VIKVADLRKAHRDAHKSYREHLREMTSDIRDFGKGLRTDLERRLSKSPEIYFALQVVLPCMIRYSTTPARLYAAAVKGNGNAIESLIRLDPRVQSDPAIDNWIHKVRGSVREGRVQLVSEWAKADLGWMPSPKAMKESAAGLVSVMADIHAVRLQPDWSLKRYKLTSRRILELFHAMARDFEQADSLGRDRDLGNPANQGWTKMVQRRRIPWLDGLGLRPDKKK